MKSTELRIGNWVILDQYPNTRQFIKLESGKDIDQAFDLNPKPIPLTEDILLKCGFEKANYEKNYPLYFNKNKTKYSDAISVSVYSDFCRVKIVDKTVKTLVYLHDFQNIYFALTNEELNINL